MKKLLLPLAFVLFIGFSFSGCKKCSTCSYTFDDAQGNPQTFSFAEACGGKKDIEEYEKAAEDQAAQFNGTVTCVKE